MTSYEVPSAVSDEDVRILLRVYVALTLAREAAGGGSAVVGPGLEAAANFQGVALREMEALLEKMMPGDAAPSLFCREELECAQALM